MGERRQVAFPNVDFSTMTEFGESLRKWFGRRIGRLSDALDVEPEYFREFRLRAITEQLESIPDGVDRLYKRYPS